MIVCVKGGVKTTPKTHTKTNNTGVLVASCQFSIGNRFRHPWVYDRYLSKRQVLENGTCVERWDLLLLLQQVPAIHPLYTLVVTRFITIGEASVRRGTFRVFPPFLGSVYQSSQVTLVLALVFLEVPLVQSVGVLRILMSLRLCCRISCRKC